MKYDQETIIIRIVEVFVLLCILYVFAFYVLKTVGIINTPVWVELSPAIAGVIASATVIIGAVHFYVRLKDLPESHEKLVKRVNSMAIGLTKVEKDVEYIKRDIDYMKKDIDYMKKDIDCMKADLSEVKTDVKHLMKCKNYNAVS